MRPGDSIVSLNNWQFARVVANTRNKFDYYTMEKLLKLAKSVFRRWLFGALFQSFDRWLCFYPGPVTPMLFERVLPNSRKSKSERAYIRRQKQARRK